MRMTATNDDAASSAVVKAHIWQEAHAYCQAIQFGSRIAAQISVPNDCLEEVLNAIAVSGPKRLDSVVWPENENEARFDVWVYSHPAVRLLIEACHHKTTPPSPWDMWAMGKVFGYGDLEVLDFITKNLAAESQNASQDKDAPPPPPVGSDTGRVIHEGGWKARPAAAPTPPPHDANPVVLIRDGGYNVPPFVWFVPYHLRVRWGMERRWPTRVTDQSSGTPFIPRSWPTMSEHHE